MAPTTYILPDLPWAVLLAPSMRDARRGDVIEGHTDAMYQHVQQVVREVGRTDLIIRQVDPPARKGFAGGGQAGRRGRDRPAGTPVRERAPAIQLLTGLPVLADGSAAPPAWRREASVRSFVVSLTYVVARLSQVVVQTTDCSLSEREQVRKV